MAAVWPGIAVTDDSLVQAIGDIRRAIGDEARAVVRTVPRRGYRLVPPSRPAADAPRRLRPWPVAALALLAAAGAFAGWLALRPGPAAEPAAASIAGPPIVAVVPFVDLAGDEASRRLGETFDKHCTHDLSRFREFQMVLRSPTFVYREQPERGLPVDYVLGGTVDRQGDRLRLTAELTSARTGEIVWSERWDRPERDVEAMREEVAQAIGNRLGGATGLIQEAGRAAARAKPPGRAHRVGPAAPRERAADPRHPRRHRGSRGLSRRGRVARSGARACRGAARPRAPAPCRVRRRPGGQPPHRPRRRGGGALPRPRRRLGLRRPRRDPAARGGSGACPHRVRHGAEPHPERRGDHDALRRLGGDRRRARARRGAGRPGGAARPRFPALGRRRARPRLFHGRPLSRGGGDDRAAAGGGADADARG